MKTNYFENFKHIIGLFKSVPVFSNVYMLQIKMYE